jgi:hypothetical protein
MKLQRKNSRWKFQCQINSRHQHWSIEIPESSKIFYLKKLVENSLSKKARIIICGAISQYNNTTPIKGPSNYLSLLVNRARMEGMMKFDYAERYSVAISDIAKWMREDSFKTREDIVQGLQKFPEALLVLFEGKNFGKLILQIAEK